LPYFDIPAKHIMIRSDSQGAIASIRNNQPTQRTKHIDVMHHFVRERIERSELKLEFVSGEKNLADQLTKPLPKEKHSWICQKMGIVPINSKGNKKNK
jgi:3'-phosphoadenosine 5'-phosphosulfate sulfotransferase (PAPS reductase)/FAD synthetase